MYVLEWRTVSALTKITLDWAQKQFVTRVHTLFYFLHDITNPQMTITTTIFTHRPRVSLAQFSSCWWRHGQLLMTSQWADNCDAIKWIVIYNLLDIDFIHGYIHGQSCKNISYPLFADADTRIYPHSAPRYPARPKAKRGIAMLSVDKL